MSVYPSDKDGKKDWYTDEMKALLDIVHLMKIDNSDTVFVIDVAKIEDEPYIGSSTMTEVMYAQHRGKRIITLSQVLRDMAKAEVKAGLETPPDPDASQTLN